MARRQVEEKGRRLEETYEDQQGASRLGWIMAAVALYGLTLLLGYIVFAVPEAGTAMGAIRNVLCGLGGDCAILIPVFLAWVATLFSLTAAGKKVSAWKSIVDGLLFLCVFTIGQLFVAETVIRNRMTISGFANFVDKSYGYGRGGGALGALLCWPLYSYLGKWGGLLATILLALLSLTATGKAARLMHWIADRAETVQHDTEQRRMVRNNDRMFDIDESRPPRRQMDPASDGAYPPPRRRPRPDGEDFARRSEPNRTRPEPEFGARPRPTDRRGKADESFEVEPKPTDRRAKPSEESAEERRRTKRPAAKKDPENAESLIDEDRFGGMSNMAMGDEPSMAPFDGSNRKPRRKKVQPDVPEVVEKMRKTKAKDVQISIDDDLTIEPEPCDVIDEPPFDVPEPQKKKMPKMKRPAPVEEPEDEESYNYPPIDLLAVSEGVTENYREADMEKARLLENMLQEFGVKSKLTGIAHGPAVTRFELVPAPGVKVNRITSLSDDIAMHLAAMSVRIEAPIPGKGAVGVEIPNEKVEMVRLRDVLESAEARKSTSKIAVGLGKDNSGRYIMADIEKMPHVLIAGQTGSGKSVCINSIITSILFRATPDEVRLILIDPKVVELSIYNDIPHLICPVVTDCKKASSALNWAVSEMEMRYKRFGERGVRNIKGYNQALKEGEKPMPRMVIIIDELADLMMVAPGEVEDSICRLAQLARAAGMHLVIATQRPSVNVITGIIKANIPTRIAFSVASQVDSRTMIDHGGAEKLLGNGDMLFVPSGGKSMRVQGAWVSDEEVHAVVSYIKENSVAEYDADMIEQMDNAARTDAEKEEFSAEYDPRLPEAVEIVVEAGQASVSMLQRRMRVGYARAGRLIDEMEQRGIVSEADGAKPRTVLITREEMNDLFEN